MTAIAKAKHIVRTQDLINDDTSLRKNPVDTSRERFQFPIGDNTGLTKTGVHFCRVPPNTTSTVLHWHSHEDEWFFIVEAAPNAAILTLDGKIDDAGTRRETGIKNGDFIGIPAGRKLAHAFSSGDEELVYLLGGSRESLDVIGYPETRQMGVVSRDEHGENAFWMIDEDATIRDSDNLQMNAES